MKKYFIAITLYLFSIASPAHADGWLSWSEFDQDGKNIQIYLSRETGDEMGAVHTITQRGMNITPSLLATQTELWIAWVDRANKLDYRLRYARIDAGTQHILESGTIATSDHKVYSPVLALTATGIPIIAWSGLDNKDEEIRLAYFQAGQWGAERRITNNNVPDTLPLFSSGEKGKLVLSWERLSETAVSIHSITLHSDFVTARAKSQPDSDAAISSQRQATLSNAFIKQMPAALQARPNRFFMGSRVAAQQ